MSNPPVMIAYGPCYIHGGIFGFDPDRVVTVLIDPHTNRPPDVTAAGQLVPADDPGLPERMARSSKRLLCPDCCKELNAACRARGLPARFDETDTSGGQVQQ
jgi:hypothetical protein